MPDSREVLFTVSTPCPEASEVVCYKDTMEGHITANHSEVSQELIVSTLACPAAVCVGSNNADHLAFVNTSQESSLSASPFVVFVHPSTEPFPRVVRACHRRDFKRLHEQRIIWLPSK
jgi:hypothetical protein